MSPLGGALALLSLGLFITFGETWISRAWSRHPIFLMFTVAVMFLGLFSVLWAWIKNRTGGVARLVPTSTDINLGVELTRDQKPISRLYLPTEIRTSHAQIIGTTGSGKTESIILPWAIHDVRSGHGLLIVDGKGDETFLKKLVGYVTDAGRLEDFRMFSLSNPNKSWAFNPLSSASPLEAAERVFSSFKFENEYYRQLQRNWFVAILTLIDELRLNADFSLVSDLLMDAGKLELFLGQSKNDSTISILKQYLDLPNNDRLEKVSGLLGHLGNFVQGETAPLFSQQLNTIDLDTALAHKQILYFQIPTMYFPTLGEATGKLVLQALQSAVARRQLGLVPERPFFACYLDDFQDYIYPGFASLLNKSRSANVGVVFSHQALGDLEKVGPEFKNVVFTNTNIKVVMRCNEPLTCETFAKSLGTERSVKNTKQMRKTLFWEQATGMESIRDVEEYKIHPNEIRTFPTGQGVITFPIPKGVGIHRMRFDLLPNRFGYALPNIPKGTKQESAARAVYPGTVEKSKTKGRNKIWNPDQKAEASVSPSLSSPPSPAAPRVEIQHS